MAQEIELKLELDNREALDRLAGRLGSKVAEIEQENLYYDTRDDAFRQARWSVRVRKEDDRLKLTLKGQATVDGEFARRLEVEEDLDPSTWTAHCAGTAPIGDIVRACAAERNIEFPASADPSQLVALGGMKNRRRVHRLPGAGAELNVELDETEYPDGSIVYEAELEVPEGSDPRTASARLKAVFAELGLPWRVGRLTKMARFRQASERIR